jgi:hypothetical protein
VAGLINRLRVGICRSICGDGTDVCNNEDGALTDVSFIFVTSPLSGQRVSSGFTARGCSRTFESNVPWRLLDATGVELGRGATLGGGADGPGPFSFSVTYSVPSRQIGHLEVLEDDPSGGESPGKPTRNVIPVVLQP